MAEMDLRIDGVSVDLPDNFTITVEYVNAIFNPDKFRGTFSYPINLPPTDRNKRIFGHPTHLQSTGSLGRTFPAELYAHGELVMKGNFKLRRPSTKGFPGFIAGEAGILSEALAGAGLQELDLGEVIIPTVPVATKLLFVECPPRHGDTEYTEDRPEIGEVTTFQFKFYYPNGSSQFETVKFAGNVESTLADLAGYVNASTIPATALATGSTLSILPDNGVPATMPELKVSTYFRRSTGALDLRDFVEPLQQLTLQSIGSWAEGQVGNATAVFPMVHNPDFYPAENKQWNGYVNYYQEGHYLANDVNSRTKYSLVPMPLLSAVLDAIFARIGFVASGAFLEDAQLRKLIFYSVVALDKQPEGYPGEALNTFDPVLTYARHLPELTVEEFLNQLRATFGLDYEIDLASRRITITYLRDILAGVTLEDWSPFAVDEYTRDQEDLKGVSYGFALDATDELTKADATTKLLPEQYRPHLVRDGKEKREAKISSVRTELVAPYTLPQARQKGVSPLFKGQGNKFAARLLFWHGLQPDANGNPYPKASNVSPDGSVALRWGGATGLYARYWQPWQEFLDSTRKLEMAFTFSINQVKNLRLREKKHVHGQNYLVERVQVSYPLRDDAPAKAILWQC